MHNSPEDFYSLISTNKTFLTYSLLLIQIEWSGDAVVHVEFNGTMPYSINDQVVDFIHIIDKNGSRRIGGLKQLLKNSKIRDYFRFDAYNGYLDYFYLALSDIKVYYRFDYPQELVPPLTLADPPLIFDWTLKFTYIPGK